MKLLSTAKQILQTKIVQPVRDATAAPRRRDPFYFNDEHVREVNDRRADAKRWIPRRRGWLQ